MQKIPASVNLEVTYEDNETPNQNATINTNSKPRVQLRQ
jgi:hypothetical protein